MSTKITNKIPAFINNLEQKVEKNLEIVGEQIKTEAKSLVRVDTGRLKRSIISVVEQTKETEFILDVGSKKTAGEDTTGPKDDNAFYALKQEEGLLPGTTPYLFPSAKNARPLIRKLFR